MTCRYLMMIMFWLLPVLAVGEVYQLTAVNRTEEPSILEEASPEQLLEREKGKKFIIEFLKSPSAEKFQLTTDKFKRLKNNAETVARIFNKEVYERIDFQEVKLFTNSKSKQFVVKTTVYWFLEGYEGVQTIYFMLAKEKDKWLVDWLIY